MLPKCVSRLPKARAPKAHPPQACFRRGMSCTRRRSAQAGSPTSCQRLRSAPTPPVDGDHTSLEHHTLPPHRNLQPCEASFRQHPLRTSTATIPVWRAPGRPIRRHNVVRCRPAPSRIKGHWLQRRPTSSAARARTPDAGAPNSPSNRQPLRPPERYYVRG